MLLLGKRSLTFAPLQIGKHILLWPLLSTQQAEAPHPTGEGDGPTSNTLWQLLSPPGCHPWRDPDRPAHLVWGTCHVALIG